MQRAYVTGGSGFIGRRLIEELHRRGTEVVALGRSDEARAAVERAGARSQRGDIADERALASGVAGADVVFHLAAKVGDWGPESGYRTVNVDGTSALVAAARSAGVSKLVHLSSDIVLLDGRPLIDADEGHPYPARILGSYARTKAAAERIVLAANGPDLETVVVRAKHVWGTPDSTLLRVLVESVHSGRFRWIDGGPPHLHPAHHQCSPRAASDRRARTRRRVLLLHRWAADRAARLRDSDAECSRGFGAGQVDLVPCGPNGGGHS